MNRTDAQGLSRPVAFHAIQCAYFAIAKAAAALHNDRAFQASSPKLQGRLQRAGPFFVCPDMPATDLSLAAPIGVATALAGPQTTWKSSPTRLSQACALVYEHTTPMGLQGSPAPYRPCDAMNRCRRESIEFGKTSFIQYGLIMHHILSSTELDGSLCSARCRVVQMRDA